MALAADVGVSLNGGASPNTLYYLALYFLVLVVRFFKIRKEEDGDDWFKNRWKHIFHVGLELVYTASGLVVLLLNDLHDYSPFIIIVYLIFVLVSSQMESMDKKFSENTVFITHFCVLIGIIAVTVWYFEYVQHNVAERKKGAAIASKDLMFRVVVPYHDMALREHLGSTFGSRKLAFVTEVKAEDVFAAKRKAVEELKKVPAFESRRRKSDSDDITPYLDQIAVQKIVVSSD